MMIKFVVLGDPFGKLNMKPIKRGTFLSLISPSSNTSYMRKVQDSYFAALKGNSYNYDLKEGNLFFKPNQSLKVEINAVFGLSKADYNKKGEPNKNGIRKINCELYPTKRPDCDNISKIILDSLNGIAFQDDSQVVDIHITKTYGHTSKVIVTIIELIS